MTTSAASDPALHTLAQYAGILTHWQDAAGRPQRVADDVLRHLLQALELACSTPGQIRASMHQLEQDRHVRDGDLLVVRSGDVPRLQCKASGRWKLILESGQVRTGTIRQDRHGWISLDPIVEAGYHRLQLGALTIMLAVVPRRCPEVRRSHTGARRPWGLVAQIYSLFDATAQYPVWLQGGSFSSVGKLAVGAAHVGADALALSPAHAMFSADPDRYSP